MRFIDARVAVEPDVMRARIAQAKYELDVAAAALDSLLRQAVDDNGMSAGELGKLIGRSRSSIYTDIARARARLAAD